MDKKNRIDLIGLINPIKIDLTDKESAILMELLDNKGYAEFELARKIDSNSSYVNELLKKLSKNKFGSLIDSISIQSFHLKDPLSLFHKIHDQRDPISKYLFKHSPLLRDGNLARDDLEVLSFSLALSLDGALIDPDLYNQERFSNVKLSKYAQELLSKKEDLKKGSIRILNRILIEDAYPAEITKSRYSLIYGSLRFGPNGSRKPYFLNPDLCTFYFIMADLKLKLELERSKVQVLEARLMAEIRGFSGFEDFFVDRLEIEKNIKDGHYDMTHFRERYVEKINTLMKFMTSNYVGELIKRYGYKVILRKVIHIYEFNYIKFIEIHVENGHFNETEIKELNQILIQDLINKENANNSEVKYLNKIMDDERTRQDANNIKFNTSLNCDILRCSIGDIIS